jgi:hypothetical protein
MCVYNSLHVLKYSGDENDSKCHYVSKLEYAYLDE